MFGVCPRCGASYTADDVAGYGILRARAAAQGGPWVDYRCQPCGRVIRLIPHGSGRYAIPGHPPGPPAAQRGAPWQTRPAGGEAPTSSDPASATARAPNAPPAGKEPPPSQPEAPGSSGTSEAPRRDASARPLDAGQARRLLGVEPGASQRALDEAFRQQSRLCHPDKVAHLDEDFQVLAEQKFRTLREAHEFLSGLGPASSDPSVR